MLADPKAYLHTYSMYSRARGLTQVSLSGPELVKSFHEELASENAMETRRPWIAVIWMPVLPSLGEHT
jgi:hypothetical protein